MASKIFLFITFLLVFNFAYSQSVESLSDDEILSFMQQAKQSGMSEEQLMLAAAAKGLTASDISKFKDRASKIQTKTSVKKLDDNQSRGVDSTDLEEPTAKEKPKTTEEKIAENKRLKIFGLNIFNNQTLNFEPNLKIPTPKNYILGTDDELSIDISGYAYAHYAAKVSTEGTIRIENLSPVFVSGYTLDQAKEKIIQRLKTIFGGVGKSGNLVADVTLSRIRSIKVTVIGEAVFPGRYTVPSLATTFNVLYAAGGPTDIGTMREIEIYRNGKKIKTLDLYDLLLKGSISNDITLQDQDLILIPYVKDRVIVNGEVRNPKMFELSRGETLAQVLQYAGGLTENAYAKSIRIDRNTASEKKILNIAQTDFRNFSVLKGDIIIVDSLLARFENKVTISGAVYKAGSYQLQNNMGVKQIILQAEGLRPEAFLNRALLIRKNETFDPTIIPIDIRKLLNNEVSDLMLQPDDELVIKTVSEVREKRSIQLDGEINIPSEIEYKDNMTIIDAIMLAGGFKYGANPNKIEIARRIKEDAGDSDQNVEILNVDVDPVLGISDKIFAIKPFDRIYVRKLARYEIQKTITITGEVAYPGPYALKDKKERISSLISKAGGVKSQADLSSAKFVRNGIQMGIDLKEAVTNENSNQNLLLLPGDVLDIPRKKETVTITGSVYNPITVPFEEGFNLKDYINIAGGETDSAYVKKSYVKYGNGRLARTKSFIGIKSYPKIESGSEIYVPVFRKQRWTAAERISVSTAVVSVVTVLITVVVRLIPNN